MNKSAYVERIVHEISKRSLWELRAHGGQLERILGLVKDLPSPEKEDAFVRLILMQKRPGEGVELPPSVA